MFALRVISLSISVYVLLSRGSPDGTGVVLSGRRGVETVSGLLRLPPMVSPKSHYQQTKSNLQQRATKVSVEK